MFEKFWTGRGSKLDFQSRQTLCRCLARADEGGVTTGMRDYMTLYGGDTVRLYASCWAHSTVSPNSEGLEASKRRIEFLSCLGRDLWRRGSQFRTPSLQAPRRHGWPRLGNRPSLRRFCRCFFRLGRIWNTALVALHFSLMIQASQRAKIGRIWRV